MTEKSQTVPESGLLNKKQLLLKKNVEKMKKVVSYLFVGVFSFLIITANPISDSSKIKELKIQYKEIRDSINTFKNENESEKEKLKQNSEIAFKTIEAQNSFIHGFGTLYSIIGLIIALLGIIVTVLLVVPIFNYYKFVKPALDEARGQVERTIERTNSIIDKAETKIEKVEDKINNFNIHVNSFVEEAKNKINEIAGEGKLEKRIENVLDDIERKDIDEQISNLESSDNIIQNHAIDMIYKMKYEKLTMEHLSNIYCTLKTTKFSNSNQKIKLIQRFGSKQSKIADLFFMKDALADEDSLVTKAAFWYFTKDKNFHQYSSAIVNFLRNSDKIENAINSLFQKLTPFGIEYIPFIINEDEIVKMLNKEQASTIIYTLNSSKYDEIRNEIKESHLLKEAAK